MAGGQRLAGRILENSPGPPSAAGRAPIWYARRHPPRLDRQHLRNLLPSLAFQPHSVASAGKSRGAVQNSLLAVMPTLAILIREVNLANLDMSIYLTLTR